MHDPATDPAPEPRDGEPRWDAQGAHALYRHHVAALYAYVRSRIDDQHDAEDVVSFTFLKAVEHLDTFHWKGASAFRAWLFRIAHNAVQDYGRSQQRRAASHELDALWSPGFLPDEAVIRHENAVLLYRLLRTLAPRRQEILRLKYFGGLRNREIAAVLALDERTVAAQLCRGIADLQQRYAREALDRHERI